jgi:hypothetical protein
MTDILAILASCLSFGLALDDNSEYVVRDAIKELASASAAEGPVAIISMLSQQGGEQTFWIKNRLEELLSVNYIMPYKFPENCVASLWKIPPVSARVAIALACVCKFIIREGGYVVFLGWNFVTSIANKSPSPKSRLRQLLAEMQNSGAHVIALQTDPMGEDPRNQPYSINVTEQGPLFALHGKHTIADVRFAVPDLVTNDDVTQPAAESRKFDIFMVVLEAVRKYPEFDTYGSFYLSQSRKNILLPTVTAQKCTIDCFGHTGIQTQISMLEPFFCTWMKVDFTEVTVNDRSCIQGWSIFFGQPVGVYVCSGSAPSLIVQEVYYRFVPKVLGRRLVFLHLHKVCPERGQTDPELKSVRNQHRNGRGHHLF